MNTASCTTLELGPLAALGGDARVTDIVVTCGLNDKMCVLFCHLSLLP